MRWQIYVPTLACVVLMLGCSKGVEPLGGGQTPELAGKPSSCDTAPIPSLIDAQFTGGHRTSVRARCANILRKSSTDPATALQMAVDLAGFIGQHSNGTPEQQIDLINALLCVSQGQAPGGSCTFSQIPPGADVNVVGPGGGGPFIVDDGKIGYLLLPGWSLTPRIIFTIPDDPCALDTPFTQFPECATHGTIPSGPFAIPQSGILAHCATVPDEQDLDNLRLARNIDSFNDPNATDAGGSEFYSEFEAPFELPGCPAPILGRTIGPAGIASAAPRLAGKRGGPGNINLAVTTKKVGGQISAFSEWGIVDIESESATIEGIVREDCFEGPCPAISGASVDLSCEDDEEPRQSTTTNVDGFYSFDSGDSEGGFAVGNTCEVNADASGFSSSTSGPFSVVSGTNTKDLFLSSD
jgi:hypothetical protein